MITRVNHIGIAVSSIEEARKMYTEVFGLKVGPTKLSGEEKMKVAWIPLGNVVLELMEPTDLDGPLAKFLQRRGEGLHHLQVEVTSMEETVKTLKEKGIPLIDKKPRVAGDGTQRLYIHPAGTGKVFIQPSEHTPETYHSW
jgi:methylmalonyl-CoA epimerase